MSQIRYRHIEELRGQFQDRKDIIRMRLAEFAAVKPEEYFYELVYCLLTPQSSAANAAKAVEVLRRADLLNRDIETASLLRQKVSYIRFHNTKAKHLAEAKQQYGVILARLCNGSTTSEFREWLVGHVKGYGWKEASHFLRNIGHRDLAILDRHILKNLKRHGVIREVPKTLTMKRYLSIEGKLRRFAATIGISSDELDLLFWSMETGMVLK